MEIYADNAATTKLSEDVLEVMLPFMKEVFGNPSSPYKIGQKARNALEDARKKAAYILNCEAREIYFTSGGTESDNQAIISAARIGEKQGKKHIISTNFEHHAVLNTLKMLEKEGFDVELLQVDSNGLISEKQVEEAIRSDTALVTIMYANNEIGTVQPISKIGEICRKKGVLFHTDAVQAAGHILIDVKKDNIDMLSLSAHKFHGPKGVGILYVKRGIELSGILQGGLQERGKRPGTENCPGIIGMVKALEDASANLYKYTKKLVPLRDKLIAGLEEIEYAKLNGDRQRRLPGTVNFCFEGIDGRSLVLLLDDKGISASSGSACTSGSSDPSHVLLAIGRTKELARGSLRLSFDESIKEEEIDYIVKSVKEIVAFLRSQSETYKKEKQINECCKKEYVV